MYFPSAENIMWDYCHTSGSPCACTYMYHCPMGWKDWIFATAHLWEFLLCTVTSLYRVITYMYCLYACGCMYPLLLFNVDISTISPKRLINRHMHSLHPMTLHVLTCVFNTWFSSCTFVKFSKASSLCFVSCCTWAYRWAKCQPDET